VTFAVKFALLVLECEPVEPNALASGIVPIDPAISKNPRLPPAAQIRMPHIGLAVRFEPRTQLTDHGFRLVPPVFQ
jgi:hypothetical protein